MEKDIPKLLTFQINYSLTKLKIVQLSPKKSTDADKLIVSHTLQLN